MHCEAEMERGTAPFHIDRPHIHVTLDEAPAWVCRQCGETYGEAADVEAIQSLIRAVEEKSKGLRPTA